MSNEITFCTKCGQKWTAGTEPKCVCTGNKEVKNTDKNGLNSIKNHPLLPSFDGLKDHDPYTKIKKKNHYKAQFQPWKPTSLVAQSKHIDYLEAIKKHDSGEKEMTFNDYLDLKKAIAVNAIIDEMCGNG